MGDTGLEQVPKSSGKRAIGFGGGAECGALHAPKAPFDPELAAVVDAWPTLPGAIKAGILAMVRAGV